MGGSCFPKDVQALIKTAEEVNYKAKILKNVQTVNEEQKLVLSNRVTERFGEKLRGFVFGVWGLAFKPETNDMRQAASIVVINELIKKGAKVKAYDPQAMEIAEKIFHMTEEIEFSDNKYDAIKDADALILITEWKEFRSPDFTEMMKIMKRPIIFDGRNQYNKTSLKSKGFEYYQIGVK